MSYDFALGEDADCRGQKRFNPDDVVANWGSGKLTGVQGKRRSRLLTGHGS